MNPYESFLVELLQGHITYDDKQVEVRRQFLPSAHLPCLTLEVVSDNVNWYRRGYEHDSEELIFNHECTIYVHVWCNSESERESISSQVLDCYHKSLNHHYRYCSRYNKANGKCAYNNLACPGNTSYKNQCIDPDTREYQCLSEKHALMFGTIVFEAPFFADEMNENPPILHSIFSTHAGYDQTVSSMGGVTDCYELNGNTIEVHSITNIEEEDDG